MHMDHLTKYELNFTNVVPPSLMAKLHLADKVWVQRF